YQGQVLPILFATWILSIIEKFLAKRIHDSIKMLVVGPVALLITGFLAFIVIGPLALELGTLITNGIKAIFETAGWLGGAVYGLFYAPLVITGLHHMFLAVDFQLMGSPLGGTYLWPIVAISNICQGSAAFGAWVVYKQRKMVKEQGLAATSGISAFLGVTEPAMFGVNLPLKYPFFAAIISSSLLGAFIGANKVLGSVGVGGVPAIISIEREYWGVFGIATLIAIVLPAILTIVLSNFANEKAKEMVQE
ncbi:MAG TPA: trehalose permease IIC protein, partial [Staphylococcus sp.]|nr:trehalose permease IIC protein [Staphylococcus sp.]